MNKYTYIGGALCFVFIISLCGTFLPPCVEFMQICRPPVIYGDYFYMFVIVNLLPVIVIIFLLLIMSLTTSFRLLKFYSEGKVAPKHVMSGMINNPSNVKSPMFATGHSSATSSKNISDDIRRSTAVVNPIEIEIQLSNLNNEVAKDHSEKEESSKKIRNQDKHYDNSSSNNKESPNKDNCVHKESQNKGMVDTNICTKQTI